jgi:regulator of sigma E protease
MSIFIFVIVLFALVLVHEFGHFIVAKWTGMRVDEFGIGFPPKILSRRRGETEYSLNALPIGGFVRIYGEDAVSEEDTGDRLRSFSAKSWGAQAAVLIAGVTMNVLFAWLLFTVAYTIGVQSAVDETAAGPTTRLVITDVLQGGPADTALLPIGAVIESVESGDASLSAITPSGFSSFIDAHVAEEVRIGYRLGGELIYTTVVPRAGILPNEPDRTAVGVVLALVDRVARPMHVAAYDAAVDTVFTTRDIVVGLVGLLTDAVLFRADLSEVAGPVGIVGLVGQASAFGFSALLMFTAFISLNLAVINLLPFPALDGGRLVFVAIEAVKGSAINPRIATALNTVGFALLILLMVAVTWNDVARII